MRTLFSFLIFTAFSLSGYSQFSKNALLKQRQEDSLFVRSHSNFLTEKPNDSIATMYYNVAAALTRLNRTEEAKMMFMNIVESDIESYNATYYHGSDIPGDTTSNMYGYGSFTSNYKNAACLNLANIFIDQKDFEQALKYVTKADLVYQLNYNCGTGHYAYRNRLRNAYALCYEGLKKYDEAFELLLPHCMIHSWMEQNKTLVRIIKEQYTDDEIRKEILLAINSITITIDSNVTTSYMQSGDSSWTINHISGKGTMQLFGTTITLPTPSLSKGETVTKQNFIDLFLASTFYTSLTGDYSHSSSNREWFWE